MMKAMSKMEKLSSGLKDARLSVCDCKDMKSVGIFDSGEVLLDLYSEMPLSLAYMQQLIISGQYVKTKNGNDNKTRFSDLIKAQLGSQNSPLYYFVCCWLLEPNMSSGQQKKTKM